MSIPYVKAGKYAPGTGDLIWKSCLRKKGLRYILFVLALSLPKLFLFFQTSAAVVRLLRACLGLLGCDQTEEKQLHGLETLLSLVLPTVSPVELIDRNTCIWFSAKSGFSLN